MSEKKERLVWIDQLKALGMGLVVWGHCIQRCKLDAIFKGIYSFHMPFFFILSGMTFNPAKFDRTIDFVKSKAKSILYPYVIISLLLIPLWLFNRSVGAVEDDSILKIIAGIFYSNSRFIRATTNAAWFMVTLFFAELLFYLLYKYFKKHSELFLASLLIALIGVMAPFGKEVRDAPFHIDVALVTQLFVCSGYLIRHNLQYINKALSQFGKYKGVILLLMVSTFFAYSNDIVFVSSEHYGNVVYFFITSFGFSISFIYLGQLIPSIKVFNFIGKNTIVYLMIHVPILRTLQFFFPIIEHSLKYASITAALLYVAILPICYLVQRFFPFILNYPFSKKEVKKL